MAAIARMTVFDRWRYHSKPVVFGPAGRGPKLSASKALRHRVAKMKRLLSAGLLVLIPMAATAHSQPGTTIPANGAVLKQQPPQIVLTFAKPIRLTTVRMARGQDRPVDLDLGDQKAFTTRFSVPAVDMGRGHYWIEWRGLASDGHAMRGAFTFRVE